MGRNRLPLQTLQLRLIACTGLVILLLVGCQRGSDSSAPGQAPSTPATGAQARAAAELQKLLLPPLLCERKGNCPSAIGELVTVTSSGVKTCTATLVRRGFVLTASHCVPWENVDAGGRVHGRCWVRWPRRGLKGQEEVIACRRVKLASPLSSAREGEAQVDYALLQLGRLSSRKPMLVAPTASQLANTRLTLFGINPSESLHTLRRFECQSSLAQDFVRKHIDPMRAFVMPGCPAVSGNSGGPILDGQGLIVGVISLVETPSPFAAAHGSAGGAVGSRLGLATPASDR